MKFILLAFFMCFNLVRTADEDNEKEKFVPTREWQIVQPGQPIPPGLHIRHDFQKKITEAKLLDESEKENSDGAVIAVDADAANSQNVRPEVISRENLKHALEKMNGDEEVFEPSREDIERVKSKFRSYDELKREFGALNLTIKTDVEIMIGLLNHFNNLTSQKGFDNVDELHAILVDFEYLVHQIDNALEFVKMKGIEQIVFRSVNFTDRSLKIEALKILSAAVQHNPKAQIYAYEVGMVPFLIRCVEDETWEVRMSALSAVNNLLRRFPTAQWKFIESQGLKAVSDLLDVHDFQTYSKLATLFTDILIDHNDYVEKLRSEPESKSRPSEMIGKFLAEEFDRGGWCLVVANALLVNAEVQDHDVTVKVLNLMDMSKSMCGDVYREAPTKTAVANLLLYHRRLSERERSETDADDATDGAEFYFTNLKDIVVNITDSIYREHSTKHDLKDEF